MAFLYVLVGYVIVAAFVAAVLRYLFDRYEEENEDVRALGTFLGGFLWPGIPLFLLVWAVYEGTGKLLRHERKAAPPKPLPEYEAGYRSAKLREGDRG